MCENDLLKSHESCNFELARPKNKKEEEIKQFGHLVTFWFCTFTILFHAPRRVVGHK